MIDAFNAAAWILVCVAALVMPPPKQRAVAWSFLVLCSIPIANAEISGALYYAFLMWVEFLAAVFIYMDGRRFRGGYRRFSRNLSGLHALGCTLSAMYGLDAVDRGVYVVSAATLGTVHVAYIWANVNGIWNALARFWAALRGSIFGHPA